MKILRTILLALLVGAVAQARAESGRVEHIGADQGMPQTRVTSVLQDSDGYIWLATWAGLARYDGYSVKTFKGVPGRGQNLPSNRINRIFQAPANQILCQIENRFFVFNPENGNFARASRPSAIPLLYHAPDSIVDKVGRLPEFEGKKFKIIYRDRQNGYWVTSNRGIDRVYFRPPLLAPYKIMEVGEEPVRCIGDFGGDIFFADKNGYIRVQDRRGSAPDRWLTRAGLTPRRAKFGADVYSSYYFAGKVGRETNDTFLIGTKPDGLYVVSLKGDVAQTRLFEPTRGLGVYDIHRDRWGRIWLASLRGLFRIDDLKSRSMVKISGFDRVRVLGELDGTLLVGGDEGLKSFRLYEEPIRVHNVICNTVVMDISVHPSDHRIFLATYGDGLLSIADNQILGNLVEPLRYTTAEGLASDNLFSVTDWNRAKSLILVSEDAISEFNPVDRSSTVATKGTFAEGFAFTECRPYWHGPESPLYLGTSQGALVVERGDFPAGSFVPNIVFSCPTTVRLSPDERGLTIRFAALDYNKSEDIVYAYRLDGIDDDWTITRERTVVYANLPPGEYSFRVKSTNGSGRWVANERNVVIYREARLTETRAFWIGVGVVTILIVILIYLVLKYIRQLRSELRALSTARDERAEYLSARLRDLLSRQPEPKSPASKRAPEPEDHFKKKVLDYLEAHYDDSELSVDQIGSALGMGHTKLFREIKLSFGVSPNILLQEYRINRAVELLARGDRNVSEVAYAVGFSDPKYFSRVFKKYKGVSPSEYSPEA